MITKYSISDIKYDTDTDIDPYDVYLPEELIVEVETSGKTDDEITEELSDAISERTGFCHFGFNATIVDKKP